MPTSGTFDFNLSVDEIIEEAYERIGMTSNSGYDLRTARRSLNIMLTEWANKKVTLWTVERRTIPLVQGQSTYDLEAKDVDLMEVALRRSGADIVLSRTSWDVSAYIPNKSRLGKPTQYKFDRQIVPRIELWPVPDGTSDSLVVDVFTFSEDVGAYSNDIATPRRFLPAIIAGLTYHLAQKKAPGMLAEKKALYEEALNEALAADQEVASFVVTPSYGRRRRR